MAQVLKATEHDIGGLAVKRILPHQKKRMVGPFIFLTKWVQVIFLLDKGST